MPVQPGVMRASADTHGHLGEDQPGAADRARAVDAPGASRSACRPAPSTGTSARPRRGSPASCRAAGTAGTSARRASSTSTSKPWPAHVARHHLVDLGDELRRAQREVVVGDRLGARHQAEGEARRVHVPEALARARTRPARRRRNAASSRPRSRRCGLEMRERRASRRGRRSPGTPRRARSRPPSRAWCPSRSRNARSPWRRRSARCCRAVQRSQRMVGKLRQSERLMISLWPCELLGEHAFEEARRLLPRRACRARRARRSPDRSPSPRSSGPARTGSNAR